jgi:outer membrane protein OmpA-like peptidoglycan-associated protein
MKNTLLFVFSLVCLSVFGGDNERFKIRNLEMNSEESDIAPAYYNGRVVFSSSRDLNSEVKRVWGRTGLGYYDLYIADPGGAGELVKMNYFNRSFNGKYNEGPASFNRDGDFMAFTQNYYESKKELKLKIMTTSNADGKWDEPIHVPFNNPDYNTAHPSLSFDASVMYFVSDMPGGYGGTDIYKVNRNEDGTWGRPQNMGDKINTTGNESFPFIHRDGLLFFSSDGHPGMGGLDVFVAHVANGVGQVEHLEAPINSVGDDFSFILSSDQYTGYFSSNREGGQGSDDLYSFSNQKKFINVAYLKGLITDNKGDIIEGASVSLVDADGAEVALLDSDLKGNYGFTLDPNKPYQLVVQKQGYFPKIQNITALQVSEERKMNIVLDKDPNITLLGVVTDKMTGSPVPYAKVKLIDLNSGSEELITTNENGIFNKKLTEKKLNETVNYNLRVEAEGYLTVSVNYNRLLDREGQYDIGVDVNLKLEKIKIGETKLEDIVEVNPIFWDLGSAVVRADAARELDKIVEAMNNNPNIYIELGSHTDSRGSDKQNLELSDKRAKAAAEYIKARITNPVRITGKGYGESSLINRCKDGVKCSEEEHQANRRTEFRITKF